MVIVVIGQDDIVAIMHDRKVIAQIAQRPINVCEIGGRTLRFFLFTFLYGQKEDANLTLGIGFGKVVQVRKIFL